MKICVGVLNWKRKDYPYEKLFKSTHFSTSNLIAGIHKNIDFNLEISEKQIVDCSNLNVAQSKNKMIKRCKELDYDLLFLFEDDTILEKPEIINKYVEFIILHDYALISCSYDPYTNRVFPDSNLPADVMRILKNGRNYNLYMNSCSNLLIFNLNHDIKLFNETFIYNEYMSFIIDNYVAGHLPFFMPLIDIDNTQESFSHLDQKSFRTGAKMRDRIKNESENNILKTRIQEEKIEPVLDMGKLMKWVEINAK